MTKAATLSPSENQVCTVASKLFARHFALSTSEKMQSIVVRDQGSRYMPSSTARMVSKREGP